MSFRHAALLLAFAALAGCGGGDGGTGESLSATGIWVGNIQATSAASAVGPVYAVIDQNGNGTAWVTGKPGSNPEADARGAFFKLPQMPDNSATFHGSTVLYKDYYAVPVERAPANGTISSSQIQFHYGSDPDCGSWHCGEIDFTRFQEKVTDPQIEPGSWEGEAIHPWIATEIQIKIAADGSFSGEDTLRCAFSGSIQPALVGENLFAVTAVYDCLGMGITHLTGTAFVSHQDLDHLLKNRNGTYLYMSLTSSTFPIAFEFRDLN